MTEKLVIYATALMSLTFVVVGIAQLRLIRHRRVKKNEKDEASERFLAWVQIIGGIALGIGGLTGQISKEFPADLTIVNGFISALSHFFHVNAIWRVAARNREVTTNVLDTCSILFVTPEVLYREDESLRFAGLLNNLSYALYFGAPVAFVWLILSFIIYSGAASGTTIFPASFDIVLMENAFLISGIMVSILFTMFAVFLKKHFSLPSPKETKRRLVYFGIVVFLASRVIAIATMYASQL